jgi:hypothetical protein
MYGTHAMEFKTNPSVKVFYSSKNGNTKPNTETDNTADDASNAEANSQMKMPPAQDAPAPEAASTEKNIVSNVVQVTKPFVELVNEFRELKKKEGKLDQKLYEVLAICQGKLLVLEDAGHPEHQTQKQDFERYVTSSGMTFGKKAMMLSKIVKCVLLTPNEEMDNRKVNAYCTVIKYANEEKIAPEGFVKFINDNGGLEKTRLEYFKKKKAGSTQVPRKDKIAEAKEAVSRKTFFTIDGVAVEETLGKLEVGAPCVLIVTKLSNGKISINGWIKDEKNVDEAMVRFYQENQTATANDTAHASTTPTTAKAAVKPMAAAKADNEINLAKAIANKAKGINQAVTA